MATARQPPRVRRCYWLDVAFLCVACLRARCAALCISALTRAVLCVTRCDEAARVAFSEGNVHDLMPLFYSRLFPCRDMCRLQAPLRSSAPEFGFEKCVLTQVPTRAQVARLRARREAAAL
jgi:hypothetical protein